MAQLSVADLHAILSGKPVPTPAPAPERGAREPDPVYYLLAPSLKRPAEASPHVSPEKPRAAESVEIEDELDPEDDDAPAPADAEKRTHFAKWTGSDQTRSRSPPFR